MSKTLLDNLANISNQKNTYLVPNNIKNGVQIFDIVGTYVGSSNISNGVKLFTNTNAMQADPTAQLNDLAMVYDTSWVFLTQTNKFSSCRFPQSVVRPTSAYGIYANFIPDDGSSAQLSITIQQNGCRLVYQDYMSADSFEVTYTSQDGGYTFEKDTGMIDSYVFTHTMVWDGNQWDDDVGAFILIPDPYFEGLYQYTTNNLYEYAPTQFTVTAENIYNATAYGPNGVVNGTLQQTNNLTVEQVKTRANLYNDLSALVLDNSITNLVNFYRDNTNIVHASRNNRRSGYCMYSYV